MRGIARKEVILVVGIVFVIMLIAGCEEQNVSNTKKSRLIAAENSQLKKELERLSVKLEQHNGEIEKQKGLLGKCLQEKKVRDKKTMQDFKEQMEGILVVLIEENVKLRQEIDRFEKEIEELKGPASSEPQ